MGWNVVNTRARRVHRDPAARRSAWGRTGTSAPPTRCTRTSTRSSASSPRWVIVLSGDHIYKMDYGKMLDVHIARGAQPHRGGHRGARSRTSTRFGVLEVDEDEPRRRLPGEARERRRPTPWNPGFCLGSMGVYIFDTDVLVRELRADAEEPTRATTSARTSSRSSSAAGERVYAYLFWDENKKESKYWRDVGTLDAYYEASMDLIQVDPVFNLYDPDWPHAHLPAAAPARPSSSSPRTAAAGSATRVDRLVGLHRLGKPGAALDPVPQRAGPLLLRHPGLDPACPTRSCTATPHPPRHHRPRRRDPERRDHRLSTRSRIAVATPSRRAAWSSSRRARSASSIRVPLIVFL